MSSKDIAPIKQKAEAGDTKSQLTLANCFLENGHAATALEWYRKAAAKGSMDARLHVGQILLYGEGGNTPGERVAPNPTEGIRWVYEAATNRHAPAYWEMGLALQQGAGVQTNLVEAYAWMRLSPQTNAVSRRIAMNKQALALDTKQLAEAQEMSTRFKKGQWPPLELKKAPPPPIPGLTLNGVSVGGHNSLAIINRRTLAEGETTVLPVSNGQVRITCIKVEDNAVLIEVEGEDEPRELVLN